MEALRRRPQDVAFGLFLLIHPLPVFFHVLAVTLFVLLASWSHFVWWTILLVVAAHTAMQISIAILNDYCDYRLDSLSKRDKPLVRGLIRPREALVLGVLAMILMVVLLIPLPGLALFFSLLYLALGQGYNLGLKSTPLSGIVFALAIPIIPVYAFVGVGHFTSFLFWILPVGVLLGIALNLANSLPDIETDELNHARTLAVVLGERGSLIVCPLLIALALVLICVLTFTQIVATRMLPFAIMLVGVVLLFGVLVYLSGYGFAHANKLSLVRLHKVYFLCVVFACLVLAGGWLIGIL